MAGKFRQQLTVRGQKVVNFFRFLAAKLKNFSHLTLGEQISYASISLGLILILVSVVLFVV